VKLLPKTKNKNKNKKQKRKRKKKKKKEKGQTTVDNTPHTILKTEEHELTKSGDELSCTRKLSSFCSTSGTHRDRFKKHNEHHPTGESCRISRIRK
jgi:hypothetical protein